ncbi:MAG: glycerol-3-phosphate dehydrogenase [Bacillota bacterium]|nr:glycerol-3-phosphate dehydrogenase [Bacillota bacterium]MDK2924419.1 glycerol-3-phosphate dehydrogenase [Bacillota bacterium]
MERLKADVVIVGAGIIGTAIARELARYELEVFLVEKEADVACGSTKANTAIVHAGYDAHPGTWKARLNVRGNAVFPQICRELEVPFKQTGTLVVALKEDEVPHLYELLERGHVNGVPDLEIIGREELLCREPNVNPKAVAALWAPTGGIVNAWELAIAQAENAVENGVKLLLQQPVTRIELEDGRVRTVFTPDFAIETRFVVNAAGRYSDEVARLVGQENFRIVPRKGEYYVFDKRFGHMANCPLFPVPTAISKGILVTPTVEGNLLIGPNAQDLEDKEDLRTTPAGLKEVLTQALELMPDLPVKDAITNFAGLRAVAKPSNDFVLGPAPGVPNFINAAGIQSPGLTAAPAVAEEVRDHLQEAGLELHGKKKFNPYRKRITPFRELSREEQAKLIEQDPRYGQIVCRCETVTEAEVVQALHRPVPCTTMDGVKRRTRAGMGRCQGGFCTPRVAAILARELGLSLDEVTKKGGASKLLLGRTKDILLSEEEAEAHA